MNCFEYNRECEAMGTRFAVCLRGIEPEHLEAVAVAVCEEIMRLDGALSRFDPRSEIVRINREAKQNPVRIDREVCALLERCERARQMTEGYFDVTAASGGNGLRLDVERCMVQFTRPDVAIDLGALGKGYALDCGREILSRYGVESALLHGGTSSVLALGQGGWPVDVRHPLVPDEIVQHLALTNRALSCSAARHPGQAISDVVNPLTGTAIVGAAACVVLAASAVEAEIFSTALLAMGRKNADDYVHTLTGAEIEVHWF